MAYVDQSPLILGYGEFCFFHWFKWGKGLSTGVFTRKWEHVLYHEVKEWDEAAMCVTRAPKAGRLASSSPLHFDFVAKDPK